MSLGNSKLQAQRFEYKYVVEERIARSARDFVRCYLDLDSFGATRSDYSYPVHSLYFDSPDLGLYRSTINGDKNRFKLRLRFYENRPEAPIFFEIKSRMNNTISKQRGGVIRDAVEPLVSGQLPEPSQMASDDPKQLVAVQNFCTLMNKLHARPRTHVAYEREAWISPHDNSIRVTMDRRVRIETCPHVHLTTDMTHPTLVFGNQVVIELKFTGRFPDWFKELVRVLGLTQCGAAKYVDGVTRLGVRSVSNAFSAEEFPWTAQSRLDKIDKISNSKELIP